MNLSLKSLIKEMLLIKVQLHYFLLFFSDKSTKSSPRTETVEIFSKIWKRSRIPEVTNGQISVATNNPCGVVTKGLIKRACQVKKHFYKNKKMLPLRRIRNFPGKNRTKTTL